MSVLVQRLSGHSLPSLQLVITFLCVTMCVTVQCVSVAYTLSISIFNALLARLSLIISGSQSRINNSSKCSNCYGSRDFGGPAVFCNKSYLLHYIDLFQSKKSVFAKFAVVSEGFQLKAVCVQIFLFDSSCIVK